LRDAAATKPHIPVIRTRMVRRYYRLKARLLCETVNRAEAPDQLAAIDTDDFPRRQMALQDVDRSAVTIARPERAPAARCFRLPAK
jgi:hypothetical protein